MNNNQLIVEFTICMVGYLMTFLLGYCIGKDKRIKRGKI